jgi:hypothetical protein
MHKANLLIVSSLFASPRLRYVCDWLGERWGLDIVLVDQVSDEERINTPVLYYGKPDANQPIQLFCNGFLAQIDLPDLSQRPDDLVWFDKACWPREDLFWAIFWELSRADEYLATDLDKYGRFLVSSLPKLRQEILNYPIIDILADSLADLLREKYLDIAMRKLEYEAILTIDVDVAFALQGRGALRYLYNSLKYSLRLLKPVWPKKDPFDTYEKLYEIAQKAGIKQRWFWLLTQPDAPLNPTINLDHPLFLTRARDLSQKLPRAMGLHPSFYSSVKPALIDEEAQSFQAIFGYKPEHSRQHFLRMRLPDTYQNLIKSGIKHDHSMGFADRTGFRAGTSRPFRWFDLATNQPTDLTIHSFVCMDVTLRDYLKYDINQAINHINFLKHEVAKTGGYMTIIWHNSSLYEGEGWQGWEAVLKAAVRKS